VNVLDDRFSMIYRVISTKLDRVACEGEGLIVAFDYRTKTKASLPEAIRARIDTMEAGR